MTYTRLVNRNGLKGDYSGDPDQNYGPGAKGGIRGDMRRLEQDSVDVRHLTEYAEAAGITTEQVRLVFARFFGEFSVVRE